MGGRPLLVAVGAAALLVHLGALANRFALDDLYIIVANPLVRGTQLWGAFVSPYWPPDFGGQAYRPLPVATYALDWLSASTTWFHGVNLLWHAGASVAVAVLARRWAGDRVALAAGLLFAVHPVHVEAVVNVVGRAELMAALCTVLAVYAALGRGAAGWSAAAFGAGLLCKENAAVVPALVVWGWIVGLARPTRRTALKFLTAWAAVAVGYGALRWWVLHPYAQMHSVAPVFIGESPGAIRLTAVAAFADIARLLVFPAHLRVDYSPAERTIVTELADARFLVGAACVALWAAVVVYAVRRGRRVEAFGLGWLGIALLPVANLVFPIGVLVAERTLYLPSVGLVLAAGAVLGRLSQRSSPAPRRLAVAWAALVAMLAAAAGARSAARVPVWRDHVAVVESVLRDSPNSYRGYAMRGGLVLAARRPERALADFGRAIAIFDRDPASYVAAADAAFTLGRPGLADSLLRRAAPGCPAPCGLLRVQAATARARGDTLAADSLLSRFRRLASP